MIRFIEIICSLLNTPNLYLIEIFFAHYSTVLCLGMRRILYRTALPNPNVDLTFV